MNVQRADVSKIRPNRKLQARNIAELPHIKCTWDSYLGEFRVTLDGLSKVQEEDVAYYTGDFEDALGTARHMSEFRGKELQMAGCLTEVPGEGSKGASYR